MDERGTEEIINILKNIPVLQGLADEEYLEIIPLLEKITYPPDTFIIHEGAIGDSMYIIIKGTVRVTKAESSKEQVSISNLYAGSYFGEFSLIDNMPRSANVISIDEAELFRLSKKDFDYLLSENTRISAAFYRNCLKETFSRFRNAISNFTFSQHILKEKTTQLDEINEDLTQAKKLQHYFINTEYLDSENDLLNGIKHSYIYEPCIEVGGDFVNIARLGDNSFAIIIADVMGHGITAALATGVIKSAFSIGVQAMGSRPSLFMKFLSDHLYTVMPELYATSYYAYIDQENRKIVFAKAGHPHPLFWRESQKDFAEIKCIGTGLGLIKKAQFGETEYSAELGDKLLLYTDGIIEQKNPEGEMFGEARLRDLFAQLIASSEGEIVKKIFDNLLEYADGLPFEDDITMLLLEF